MDHYQFPHITHISQCLAAIEGRKDFIVAEKDGHTIINYYMMGSDTFPPVTTHREWTKMIVPNPDTHFKVLNPNGNRYYSRIADVDYDAAIRRECRGIVFGPDGKVIARRLHKFFNFGEREETLSIDVQKQHLILEKLDGSMITPIPLGDVIRWGTKMGLTSVAFQAEEFVARNPDYVELARYCSRHGVTPIFEWCSRKQRIVVDYPQDSLTLIAARANITGDYWPYSELAWAGHRFGIPIVQTKTIDGSAQQISEYVRGLGSDIEGFVIRWDDGHMVKLKTDDYVRIHRAKDSIMQEKRVIEMIMAEKVDDVLPHLPPHDKHALTRFSDEFVKGLIAMTNIIGDGFEKGMKAVEGDRKRFALEVDMDSRHKSVCFAVWDKHGSPWLAVYKELSSRIEKSLGSNSRVEQARWMWRDLKWADYISVEDVS